MAGNNPWEMVAAEFVQAAAYRRATIYRGRAPQFIEMAQIEPIGPIRNQLLALAARYEELGAGREASRAG